MDFARTTYCILGLPFDSATLSSAAKSVCEASDAKSRLNIVTPNLNFLSIANNNVQFRNAIVTSDLNLADGMPFIWIAKLLGLPIRERVAGSDLFGLLSSQMRYAKLKVFFFGGEKGVAEKAAKRLNESSHGLTAVGHHYPGFTSVEDMSCAATINKINQADPDFLVLALGANKGLNWIEHNKDSLNAPVLSHLGAVVNFEAGNIARAPVWMQNTGLEWLWRTLQEPVLFSRYATDGALFIKLLLTRVIPYALWLRKHRPALRSAAAPHVEFHEHAEHVQLTLGKSLCDLNLHTLKPFFKQAAAAQKDIRIDFSDVDYLDSAFLGLLLELLKNALNGSRQLQLANLSSRLRKIFYWHNLEYLV